MRFFVQKARNRRGWWVMERADGLGIMRLIEVSLFKTKREAERQAEAWNAEERSRVQVVHCGRFEFNHRMGMHHIADHDRVDWDRLREDAERDRFQYVWVHYPNVVTLELYRQERGEAGAQ